MAKSTAAYNEVSISKDGGKKKLSHFAVHPAKNGGFSVEHHHHYLDGFSNRPDIFAFGSGPETIHHLMDRMGVKVSHLKGGNDEAPGGKPDHEVADKEKKVAQGHRRKVAEEKGTD